MLSPKNFFPQQPLGLTGTLTQSCAEVEIVYMYALIVVRDHVGEQTSPTFSAPDSQIEIMGMIDVISREQCISISVSSVHSVLAERGFVSKLLCNERYLVVYALSTMGQYLLKCDNIRINFQKHICNARGTRAQIDSTTFMDVIADDAETFTSHRRRPSQWI
jgi:hypothetical protein